MRVIRKDPGRKAEVVEIENTLEALQKAVGGYIETLTLAPHVCLVCDEEGKLKGKPVNFCIGGDFIAGTALFVGVKGDEFCDIAETRIRDLMTVIKLGEGAAKYRKLI